MLKSFSHPLVLLTATAVFVSLLSPTAQARNEKAEYEACLKLTKREPELAFESALSWRDKGGGFPARHCAAIALVEMDKHHIAAPRFEKLANDMYQAGNLRVVPMLSQAANAWLLANDPTRAYAVITSALKIEPNNIDLLIDRSHILASASNFQQAFDDLDLALRIDPTRADALAFRAAALRHLGDDKRAFEDADLALSLEPDNLDALLERGIQYRLAGELEKAQQDWDRILELSPNSPAGEIARKNIEKLVVR